MPVLSSQSIQGSNDCWASNSFGPFLRVDEETYLLDTQLREVPIWLGHLASPMCGVLQHQECWTGEWSEEMRRIKQAYLQLLERTKNGLCGKLWLQSVHDSVGEMDSAVIRYPAELIYQYTAVSILDQFSASHQEVSESIEFNCNQLFEANKDLFGLTYCSGPNFEFGFEFDDPGVYRMFVDSLPKAGIHNTRVESQISLPRRFPTRPLGENRCVIRLNLAYRKYLTLFWERIRLVFENFQDKEFEYPICELDSISDQSSLLDFQRGFQTAQNNRRSPERYQARKYLEAEFLARGWGLQPVIVDGSNYAQFRSKILEMQIQIYEPVRRSPPEEFDMLFDSECPLSILVLDGDEIAAMAFAGRLGLFRQERGVSSDPFVDDPSVYYSMDLTVREEFRGGMGRLLKQAMVMLAIDHGVTAIHGRNRDRLAAGMWAINLSLGSYELQHLPDDYPDDEKYRDCIYYRCPLTWKTKLSNDQLNRLSNLTHLQGLNLDSARFPDLR